MKRKIYRLSILLCGMLLSVGPSWAQQLKLGNNPTVIDKTALLELESNNQGLLLPRISDTNAFHPNPIPNGMLIYYVGTSDSCLMIRKDGKWVKIVDFLNLAGQETDPIATAKTVSISSGNAAILVTGGTQQVGNNPNFSLSVPNTSPIWNADSLQNVKVSATAPTANQFLAYNSTSSAWTPTTMDTGYIGNFYQKVRSELSAGTGISYNSVTGQISNTGVLSINGNTGAISMDTGYIPNFYQKVRGLINAGTGIGYNSSTGVISNTGVLSFNGRTGAVTAQSGDYNITQLAGVSITTPSTGQLLQYNGTNWVNWTPNYLTGNQTITLSGDVTGSGTTSITTTLANSGVTAGTYGDATHVGQFTVNAKGLITSASNVSISFPVTSVNGSTGAVSLGLGNLNNVSLTSPTNGQLLKYNGTSWVNWTPNYLTTESDPVATAKTVTINAGTGITVTGSAQTIGNNPSFTIAANNTSAIWNANQLQGIAVNTAAPTAGQLLQYDGASSTWKPWTPNYLTGNQTITLSGDVSGSGTTSISTTLANTGVTAGTYGSSTAVGKFTVDAKGRITSASNVNIAFPVTSVNGATGAVSLGLGNLNNVSLSSPSSGQLLQYNGTNWVNWTPNFLTAESDPTSWHLTGNSGTSAGTNFLGTTDNQDLVFKTNGTEQMRITAGGNVGIGTNTPLVGLHVNGQAAFGTSVTTTRLQSGTPNGSPRTFSLIDNTAVMRVWRFTNNTGYNPAVELIWGNNDDAANSANKWWDFYVLATDAFSIRRRTGNANQDMLTITYNSTNNNGNVGINTTNPLANLDVNGNFKLGAQGTVLSNIIKIYNFPVTDNNSFNYNSTRIINVNLSSVLPAGYVLAPGATVIMNPREDLPDQLAIGWVRVFNNTTIRFGLINSGGSTSLGTVSFDITIIQ